MIRSLIFLSFLSPLPLFAEAPRDCSLKTVKDVCADHSQKPKGVINPWEVEKTPMEEPVNDEFEAMLTGQGSLVSEEDLADGLEDTQDTFLKFQDVSLKAQAELLSSLSKGSSVFKLAISSPNTLMMMGGLIEAEKEGSDFVPGLTLPWPPDSSKQETQIVSWNDFKAEYLDRIPSKDKNLLLSKANELTTANRKITQENNSDFALSDRPEVEESPLTPRAIRDSALNKIKADHTKRIKGLFDDAKKYLIEEIQLRSANGDKEKIDLLVEKIKSVEFAGIDAMDAGCEAESDGAFYNRALNKLTVCNGLSVSSDLRLMHVLAHELGHSIDPCAVTGSTVQFNKSPDELRHFFLEQKSSGMSFGELELAIGAIENNERNLSSADEFIRPEILQMLEKNNYLTVTHKGIKGTYPFDTTYRCLASRHGFSTSSVGVSAFIEKRMQRYPHDKDKLPSLYVNKEFKECLNNETSEMSEVMADVFAAKVMGRYAIDSGKNDFRDLLGSQSYLPGLCLGRAVNDNHLYDNERYEKILIADPMIQKAFNCKETSDSYCMKKFGHLPHQISFKSGRLPKNRSDENGGATK